MALATAFLATFGIIAALLEYYVLTELQSSSDKMTETYDVERGFMSRWLKLSAVFGFLTAVFLWTSALSTVALQARHDPVGLRIRM